jgi:hypothetical protein
MVELQESRKAGIGSRTSMLGESLGIVELQESPKEGVVTNQSMPGENLGMAELQESREGDDGTGHPCLGYPLEW